jgi:hypothetical protein
MTFQLLLKTRIRMWEMAVRALEIQNFSASLQNTLASPLYKVVYCSVTVRGELNLRIV